MKQLEVWLQECTDLIVCRDSNSEFAVVHNAVWLHANRDMVLDMQLL